MSSIIMCVCLSLAAGTADSVTLSHGGVLMGQVQSVTLEIASRPRQISRSDIRSLAMGVPGGDSTVVVGEEELSGKLLRIEIKTATATTTVERDMIRTVALGDVGGTPSRGVAKRPAQKNAADLLHPFSDRITLKSEHVLHAVVAAVQFDDKTFLRGDIESLTIGGRSDTLRAAGGQRHRGQLKSLRVRLAVGIVDLDRSEFTSVKLAKASADNPPPPPQSSEQPTAEQASALAGNSAAKDACAGKVGALKSEALSKIAAKYGQAMTQFDVDIRMAETDAARAQERVQAQRNTIESLRKEMDRTHFSRRASFESRIREANANIRAATDVYRKAAEKYSKTKAQKEKLQAARKADEQAVVRWADGSLTALAQMQAKNGYLIMAGVPLDASSLKSGYESLVTGPPAIQDDGKPDADDGKRPVKTDAAPAGKKSSK
ncbi:MAG: hypothetical protein ABFD92_12210 [Planctomycetaceae bacterium]|nr:hypothetical protein [Planctomycetaceae bacterium]